MKVISEHHSELLVLAARLLRVRPMQLEPKLKHPRYIARASNRRRERGLGRGRQRRQRPRWHVSRRRPRSVNIVAVAVEDLARTGR
jgi:hypothetical protein